MFNSQTLKKSVRITIGTLIIYGLLVATHLGEFWPFSIYPMFSQAGHPWKRAIVQDVSGQTIDELWITVNKDELPGKTVPLNGLNVNTNDIANYLSKTEVWTSKKVLGIRKLLQKELIEKEILVYQAQGELVKPDSINIDFTPFIYLTPDTTILSNKLTTDRK